MVPFIVVTHKHVWLVRGSFNLKQLHSNDKDMSNLTVFKNKLKDFDRPDFSNAI